MERKNMWEGYSEAELKELEAVNARYRECLDVAKTERECVKLTRRLAEEQGYQNLKTFIENGTSLKAGDKVYAECMGKTIVLFQIGKEPMEKGMNILGAHVDSPRLDVKQNPLYEDSQLAYLDTHYYGGIKKYQWVTIPLALHGVFAKKDGTVQEVSIGEKKEDPVFVISDLLIHISQEQLEKKASVVIEGEGLDLLIGSKPVLGDSREEKEAKASVKNMVLDYLKKEYGVDEEDFLSAELELVPAYKSCDIGFDRSLIGSYGQDDRVCAYPALTAVLEVENPQKTALAILTDKEEIGSVGNTGLESDFLRFVIGDLAKMQEGVVTKALRNSKCLSADVNAGIDPTFQDVMERKNASFLNYGVVVTKYTGSRGKSGTSDASAEYVAEVRAMLDNAGVIWQTGELGKVDIGGGGTVAMFIANMGVDVVDLGVPVLSMHAPFETTAKFDVYMCYRAMYEFMK